jgi:N-methylhydantoinase B/oxoprolinase/acetone carboxylase alpha subunit
LGRKLILLFFYNPALKMKSPSITQLEKELRTLEPKKILEICVRLAKHKKENKELLAYLLFDSNNEKTYIEDAKKEIDALFYDINRKTSYTTKKGLQKIVRNMNKLIKYSKSKTTELEIRIYFCRKVRSSRINLDSSAVISNLYYREMEKIRTIFSKLHEDLQLDYRNDLEELGIS